MKVVIILSLVSLAWALPTAQYEPVARFYHESIGVKEASRIKAAEKTADFDGSRIVGGGSTLLGHFPHLGGLVVSLVDGRISVCGSSLLSNNRLITAAHCWFDGSVQAREFEVVLGSLTLFTGGTRLRTSNVIMHENWNPETISNDIAMITVPWVTFNTNIRNIGLPAGMLLVNTFVGFNSQAAGFGRQSDFENINQGQTLHQVAMPVITNAVCQQTFGSLIQSTNICTSGAGGRSPCGGDSGGPLQVNIGGIGGSNILIGVVSFGAEDGCERGYPAVYARVTAYNTWIQARLIGLSIPA